MLKTMMKTAERAERYLRISKLEVMDLKTLPRRGIRKKMSKMWMVK